MCGLELSEYRQRKRAKFCCDECRARYVREQYHLANPGIGAFATIPSATVGTIAEFRVAVDLLIKGYHVFRAMSPSCPCDIAILKEDKLLRLEVKTGYRTGRGTFYKTSTFDPDKHDVLAIVLHDKIIYEPAIE